MPLRVLTAYHAGRDAQHRQRHRALTDAGVEVVLVTPDEWPEPGAEGTLSSEPFRTIELPVVRAGDVNRHSYADRAQLRKLIDELRPDIVDIQEEPYSVVARQWLSVVGDTTRVVMYAAQNIDKRYPPPFAGYERAALRRVDGIYPCGLQAAAVARGKGFAGIVAIVPLGYDAGLFHEGRQTLESDDVTLMLAGRLAAQKGVEDAVHVLAHVHRVRPARLVLAGEGPMAERARTLAASLGLDGRLELLPWRNGADLAALYRSAHVVLVPTHATQTWTEQFGRVITEGQASGAVVAGYATGAIPEVAGAAGVLVPPGDVDRLGKATAELLTNRADFERHRRVGQQAVTTRSWPCVARAQLELYEAVRERPRRALPRSPRARRALAHEEFGPTAEAIGGFRPFALPLLRRGGPLARALAVAIDAAAEGIARLR